MFHLLIYTLTLVTLHLFAIDITKCLNDKSYDMHFSYFTYLNWYSICINACFYNLLNNTLHRSLLY